MIPASLVWFCAFVVTLGLFIIVSSGYRSELERRKRAEAARDRIRAERDRLRAEAHHVAEWEAELADGEGS